MIVKKLIKPISKYGLANVDLDNYYTKPETDNKIEEAISQISQPDLSNYYDKSEIDSKVDTINNDIDNLESNINNCVKKNENENVITASRLLKYNFQEQTLFTFNNSREKKLIIDYGSYSGYRNWNHFVLKAGQDTQLLDLYFKDVNEGMWLNVENNKINFDNPTLIGGVATPVGNNDVANKAYVDNKISNIDLSLYAKLNDDNQDITLNNLVATSVYTNSAVFNNENKEPKVGFVYQNDNLEILNYPNESYTPTSNDSLANKAYVDSQIANIPQPQEINLVEGVEVAIPNYKVNNKQVYKKYCTTDSQVRETLSITDVLINMSGMVAKTNGTYRQCPWMYSSSECYFFDSSVSSLLSSRGNATTGHKIILEYTKK